MTTDATGLPVLSGPAEATAAGNVMMLARAMGHVQSLEHARRVIACSFPVTEYFPGPRDAWNQACDSYIKLKQR